MVLDIKAESSGHCAKTCTAKRFVVGNGGSTRLPLLVIRKFEGFVKGFIQHKVFKRIVDFLLYTTHREFEGSLIEISTH